METRICPVCGREYGRIPRYHNGKYKGLSPWPDTCSRGCRGKATRSRSQERFWSHVDQSGGPDACWDWERHTDTGGYGVYSIERNLYKAHRVAWSFTHNNGILPKESVLHSCDNRRCCNPRHLRLGNQFDNMLDMVQRGRHGRTKFTTEDVQEIRRRLKRGDDRQQIADDYGVTYSGITNIKSGHRWSWLPDT